MTQFSANKLQVTGFSSRLRWRTNHHPRCTLGYLHGPRPDAHTLSESALRTVRLPPSLCPRLVSLTSNQIPAPYPPHRKVGPVDTEQDSPRDKIHSHVSSLVILFFPEIPHHCKDILLEVIETNILVSSGKLTFSPH